MIFYFSGTGNSYAMAKQIADKLEGEKLIPLAGFEDFESCKNSERIGIAFPCYIGKAPDIVLDFKRKLFNYVDKKNTYIFCIVTYANSAATSYLDFKDNINSWFEIKMPENDIANSKVPSKEKEKELLSNAKNKIKGIAQDIIEKNPVIMYGSRVLHGLLLKVVSSPMNKMYKNFNENLYADHSCIKCKQCTKYCPLKNISFDDKPVWGSNCVNCFGCVNRCPKGSIQFKNKTIGKERYVHPDYVSVYY